MIDAPRWMIPTRPCPHCGATYNQQHDEACPFTASARTDTMSVSAASAVGIVDAAARVVRENACEEWWASLTDEEVARLGGHRAVQLELRDAAFEAGARAAILAMGLTS